MKNIESLDLSGKKVLVRVDFNVPLDKEFNVVDGTRIDAALPTIRKILDSNGSVVLMSHLGRPKNGPEDKFSLKHVTSYLGDKLSKVIKFADDCVGENAFEMSKKLKPGEVLLLENTRFYTEETKGDEAFAEKLAKHGDVYVNDAFGSAHRAHASTTIAAKFFKDKAAGYLLGSEVTNAQKVMDSFEKPYTAIMGGAKISDKILIIERLLDKVDNLIVGGGMCYTFFKAIGGSVGKSLVEEDKIDLAKELISKAKEKGVDLILPIDSVIADEFDNDAKTNVSSNHSIPDGWMGLDIGPEAREVFSKTIKSSKTILWNGPMGVFEMSNFSAGTNEIAKAVAEATENGAFSLIGGGDSAAAVNKLGYSDKVSYVSTGGGALLEYMEGKVLPGIAALED
ncbi:MAG: phosphoglycerate kinase [Bacteroidota bacterium]